MKNVRETSTEIEAIAADWAVRTDDAPLDTRARQVLDEWLSADIRRRGAFARAQAMLVHARRAKALGPDFDANLYAASHAENRFEPRAAMIEGEDRTPGRRSFLRWVGTTAAGAAALIFSVAIGYDNDAQAYATQRGEIRLIPLQDGSRIMLNTASSAKVRFTGSERHVDLDQGEASFDVAQDKVRPFVVVVGDASIRAVGTSFTVRKLDDEKVEILVREGVVEIQRLTSGNAAPARANANSRVLVDHGYEVKSLTSDAIRRKLAWRQGMLAFEDQPLSEAAKEFNRYSDRRIEFGDPAIASETITGLYATSDPRGFARSAALSLGLHAETTNDRIVLKR